MATYESSITLLRVNDGQDGRDGNAIQIRTNQEEILKYFGSNNELLISPEVFSFALFDNISSESMTVDGFTFNITRDSNNIKIKDNLGDKFSFYIPEDYINNKDNEIIIDFKKFLFEYNKFNYGNFILIPYENIVEGLVYYIIDENGNKIEMNPFNSNGTINTEYEYYIFRYKDYTYIENTEFAIDTFKNDNCFLCIEMKKGINTFTKVLSCHFGTNQDLATFTLNAVGINAAVQNSKLNFDANGLSVTNGGITIYGNNEYELVEISEFLEGVDYYEFDENNNIYKKTEDETPSSNKNYYLLKDSRKFYINPSGNLYLTGTVHATDGSFTGTINATDGSFTGTINANDGLIGGFRINENALYSTEGSIKYSITEDIQVNPLKKYYIINSAGEYEEIIVENFEDGIIYYELIETPSIILKGKEGEIIAKKMTLGEGVTIENYLQIGGAKIYNPDVFENNGLFIESGDIQIYENGIANFGQIKVNGSESTLYSDSWSITPDKAIFNNIDISGIIHAATFEYGTAQTVSGSMLFKTSAKIESFEDNIITVNTLEGFQINDYVYFHDVDSIGQIVNINEENSTMTINEIGEGQIDFSKCETVIHLYSTFNYTKLDATSFIIGTIYYEKIEEVYEETKDIIPNQLKDYYILNDNDEYQQIIFNFPQENIDYYILKDNNYEEITLPSDVEGNKYFEQGIEYYIRNIYNKNNYLIGINSGDSQQGQFLYGRGITLSEVEFNTENNLEPTPKVFIGDLESLVGKNLTGYGLYGENVFLTGSLTTQIEPNNSYAGINTLSPIYTDLGERIVLWAGAEIDESGNYDIKQSSFQVTQDGSIYANKGTFRGALITESKIEGADLYAIRLHGGKENNSAALNIYDAGKEKGIIFWKDYKTEEETGEKVLKIDETGFYYKDNEEAFIALDNKIIFNGDKLTLTEEIELIDRNNSNDSIKKGFRIRTENDGCNLQLYSEQINNTNENNIIDLPYIRYKENELSLGNILTNINITQDLINMKSKVEIGNNLIIGNVNMVKVKDDKDINIGVDIFIT